MRGTRRQDRFSDGDRERRKKIITCRTHVRKVIMPSPPARQRLEGGGVQLSLRSIAEGRPPGTSLQYRKEVLPDPGLDEGSSSRKLPTRHRHECHRWRGEA